MLTAKQFAAGLGMIRKYDDAMRVSLSECFAYCLHQWHSGKNRNPHDQLVTALNESGGFLSKIAPKLTLGKRDPSKDERRCVMQADATVGALFASREQEKEIRAANKAARDATKAKVEAQNESAGASEAPKAVELRSALIDATGMMIDLTPTELAAVMNTLRAVRMKDVSEAPLRLAA